MSGGIKLRSRAQIFHSAAERSGELRQAFHYSARLSATSTGASECEDLTGVAATSALEIVSVPRPMSRAQNFVTTFRLLAIEPSPLRVPDWRKNPALRPGTHPNMQQSAPCERTNSLLGFRGLDRNLVSGVEGPRNGSRPSSMNVHAPPKKDGLSIYSCPRSRGLIGPREQSSKAKDPYKGRVLPRLSTGCGAIKPRDCQT
jgi:hypothetical protein